MFRYILLEGLSHLTLEKQVIYVFYEMVARFLFFIDNNSSSVKEVVDRDSFMKDSPRENFNRVRDLNFSDFVKHFVGMDASVNGISNVIVGTRHGQSTNSAKTPDSPVLFHGIEMHRVIKDNVKEVIREGQ